MGDAILRGAETVVDRLIGRTLVYGLLTALLAGVYATVCSWSAGCWIRPPATQP
jgi:hypothetical protein